MTKNFLFYILDKVSETIIGTFWAKSEAMAIRLMKAFDYKKANLDPNDVVVYVDPCFQNVNETYTEVMQNIGKESNILKLDQMIFDFDGDNKNA
jgi:hypothetical protein